MEPITSPHSSLEKITCTLSSEYFNPSWKWHIVCCYQLDISGFPCREGGRVMLLPDWRQAARGAGINQMGITAGESNSGSVSCNPPSRLLWQVGTARPAKRWIQSRELHYSLPPALKQSGPKTWLKGHGARGHVTKRRGRRETRASVNWPPSGVTCVTLKWGRDVGGRPRASREREVTSAWSRLARSLCKCGREPCFIFVIVWGRRNVTNDQYFHSFSPRL